MGDVFAIKEEAAQAVIERAVCACGHEMVAANEWLLSSPPKIAHHCQSCKAVVMLGDRYPRTVFRPTPSGCGPIGETE